MSVEDILSPEEQLKFLDCLLEGMETIQLRPIGNKWYVMVPPSGGGGPMGGKGWR